MSEVKLVRQYRAVVIQQKHDCDFLVYRGEWKESFFDADTELRNELRKRPGNCGDVDTRLFSEREPEAPPKTMTFSEAVAKLKDGATYITRLHPDWVGDKRRVCQGADGRLLITSETDYMLTDNWVPMLESLIAADWVAVE